jgi:uncharacterized protein (TIGR03435 family)
MLQAILEERFGLTVRREAREMPVYHLTVASSGPMLRPFKEGSCVPIDPAIEGVPPPLPVGERFCARFMSPKPPNFQVDAEGATLDEFASLFLSGQPFVASTELESAEGCHLSRVRADALD